MLVLCAKALALRQLLGGYRWNCWWMPMQVGVKDQLKMAFMEVCTGRNEALILRHYNDPILIIHVLMSCGLKSWVQRFLRDPTISPKFLVTVTDILFFFVVLRVEILDFIADFEVDLIALSSALHACGIASRWEEASPGNGAMGSRYFQGGSKRFNIGARWDEKIICEETMAKTLGDL